MQVQEYMMKYTVLLIESTGYCIWYREYILLDKVHNRIHDSTAGRLQRVPQVLKQLINIIDDLRVRYITIISNKLILAPFLFYNFSYLVCYLLVFFYPFHWGVTLSIIRGLSLLSGISRASFHARTKNWMIVGKAKLTSLRLELQVQRLEITSASCSSHDQASPLTFVFYVIKTISFSTLIDIFF